MPKSKIVLSSSRDIPFDKLVLSQANVRRIKAGVSIEELAEDIARRTLLQSLTVRPVVDEAGHETGMFEIPAGGRRYRALELLVKQKRLAKDAPVPCVVRTEGLAEEDSLAENVQRAPLHPLDQFRAFQAMREKGQSEEEIAAAFFVAVAVVRQRLRLAAVSPKLLDIYAEDGMTLDQLMAFTVNPDHERQEQVFDRLRTGYGRDPFQIRRMLTEGTVRASDKRAQYLGLDAYVEAGGMILRDLFQSDDGGWLQDATLLDRLVSEKLEREAEAVRAEGWTWIEVGIDFPYGHTFGLRRLSGEQPPLTPEQEATKAALETEFDEIEAQFGDGEDFTEEADQRLSEIETALAEIDDRPEVFEADEKDRAGAFVSLDAGGKLKVERGFVRPEDEPPVEEPATADVGDRVEEIDGESPEDESEEDAIEPEEDDGLKPLPDRLVTELTAHRTVALRNAVGEDPAVAYLAVLHVFALRLFYTYGSDSCLEVEAKNPVLGAQAPGLGDTPAAQAIDARHEAWRVQLPKDSRDLWDGLCGLDTDSREALFAHCVGLTVNAVQEPYNRRPRAIAHADRLAQAVKLDMVVAGWRPTVDTFFGRVTKARILAAVREACGDAQAQLIDHLKKDEMAAKAEEAMADSGWLPEPLRTPGDDAPQAEIAPEEVEAIVESQVIAAE